MYVMGDAFMQVAGNTELNSLYQDAHNPVAACLLGVACVFVLATVLSNLLIGLMKNTLEKVRNLMRKLHAALLPAPHVLNGACSSPAAILAVMRPWSEQAALCPGACSSRATRGRACCSAKPRSSMSWRRPYPREP